MLEIQIKQSKKVFRDVTEISKQDYVSQVNEAGEGIWVVLHVYKQELVNVTFFTKAVYLLGGRFGGWLVIERSWKAIIILRECCRGKLTLG